MLSYNKSSERNFLRDDYLNFGSVNGSINLGNHDNLSIKSSGGVIQAK